MSCQVGLCDIGQLHLIFGNGLYKLRHSKSVFKTLLYNSRLQVLENLDAIALCLLGRYLEIGEEVIN